METRHTKGPWFLDEEYKGYLRGVIGLNAPAHGGIAEIVWVMEEDARIGEKTPKLEANAHLICAAPELLQALFNLVEGAGKPEPMLEAKALLKRLEGKV